MVDAQTWFKDNYETKKNSKAIVVKEGTELQGDLEIKDYLDLETIFLPFTKEITKLTIVNCPKIAVISVWGNKIKEIKGLGELKNLKELNINENQLGEIDISSNNALEVLYFRKNPTNFKFTGGFGTLKNLLKLVTWNSADTFPLASILEGLSENDLKEVADKLGLKTESKSKEDIKKEIIAEIEKKNQNEEKLKDPSTGIPDLLNDKGEIDKDKLEKLKNDAKKYENLVGESKNDSIKSADKNDIDQTELTKAIEAKKAAEEAIKKLGVTDLGTALDGKLGGKRLDEIPDNKTLKELIEESKKSKDLLDKAGIKVDDPNAEKHAEDLKNAKDAVDKSGLDPTADIGKQITDLKEKSNRLEIIVKGVYGEKYELERWEAKIEIPNK